ncbi:hypothetical protein Hypma_003724 [Hypsizygus marmoreus]|uniref:N-acetyltransferase domain-containing protein n=1 Tax=Hypsizygus marmoreus TaxID=39966 RepID=A0A151V5R4_HYPMA|nr:hypothetical protein Hypma_005512 [Hypsizygus marmoreus]RDB15773.1 hypothetical protein Hypma_003724 [Hypsizygus marmoreus]
MASTPPLTVRWLKNPSEAEITRIIDVLETAFDNNDPFTDFLTGGNRSLVRPQFAANARAAALGGEIEVATLGLQPSDIVGVGIWFGPGQAPMSTQEQREAGWDAFITNLSADLNKWWLEYLLPTLGRLADESLGPGFKLKQWHLHLFGVVPEHHGKGVGKALMAFAEERTKADGVSIVLETTTDVDIIIYKRLGFEIKGQVTVTSPKFGDCQVYQMMKTL